MATNPPSPSDETPLASAPVTPTSEPTPDAAAAEKATLEQTVSKEAPPKNCYGLQVFITVLVCAIAAGGLFVTQHFTMSLIARWIGCLALCFYGWRCGQLTKWIFVAMVLGVEAGCDFPAWDKEYQELSYIFLRMIKTAVAPLLFATLVVGIAGHANLKEVGRMGIKALIYFEIVTTFALAVGLIIINVVKAGEGVPAMANATTEVVQRVDPPTGLGIIVHAFPENIAKAVYTNDVLQVVIFSCFFAIAIAQLPLETRKPLIHIIDCLSEAMFKFTGLVMYLAPIGVGGAIAYTVSKMGLQVLANLAYLVFTLYGALIVFVLCVLIPVMLLFRLDIVRFFKTVAEPVTLAFATTSSEAALPIAMQHMTHYGVPRHIVAFIMPTGYSFNLDGTTLYLALASVFVAQAAGIELTITQQIVMMVTLMVTSKGVAGVPRASLIILLGTAASFGLPEWPIMAILGVDALMDMGRTATNVMGNCLASAVVARWEGQLTDGDTNFDEEPVAQPAS